jgi:hypothetical protein
MVVDEVDLRGHTLIMGMPASLDGLLGLLAPLRSKRLVTWRPIVIIDKLPPRTGGTWDAVAQLADLYFIEVCCVCMCVLFLGMC